MVGSDMFWVKVTVSSDRACKYTCHAVAHAGFGGAAFYLADMTSVNCHGDRKDYAVSSEVTSVVAGTESLLVSANSGNVHAPFKALMSGSSNYVTIHALSSNSHSDLIVEGTVVGHSLALASDKLAASSKLGDAGYMLIL